MTALEGVKTAVKTAVATPPGWRIANRARRPGAIVILYHRIGLRTDPFPNLDVDSFAAQIAWLARHCHMMTPAELRDCAVRDTGSGRPDVLITFDDGYRNYFDLAYPVLQAHGVHAVNFLCTRYIDDPMLIGWWDKLLLGVRLSTRPTVQVPWLGAPVVLDPAGRAALLRSAKDFIKERPADESGSIVDALLDALDVDESMFPAIRQMMTWDEVRAASELTCFGGHTHNHTIVSQLDAEALESEIRTCRDRLVAETGAASGYFAYPNGRAIDFNEPAKAVLRRYGFDTAFTAIAGLNDRETDWMEVRRISGGRSIADLAWRISRLWR